MKSSLESESAAMRTNAERVGSNFPSRYGHFNALRNKGAIVVLSLVFSVQFVLHVFSPYALYKEGAAISPFVVFILSLLLYPLYGYLGGTHYGRYNMIKWSLRALWLISILFCVVSALLQYFNPSSSTWLHHAYSILLYAVYAPVFICLGVFLVNAFPFASDQLADASSGEIVSFFHWILWVWFLSGFLAALS